MLWLDTWIALHIVHLMLVMFLLSIQLIFSLLSFVCFLSFPIYMQVFLGLEPFASGEQAWIPRQHRLLRATFYLFYAFLSFTFHVSYYGTCMPVSLGHCIYIMFLTMGVFTTSWWVVNQPIVMIIFPYAFYILMLVYISPF